MCSVFCIDGVLLMYCTGGADSEKELAAVDFVVCLGGDGTLLYVSTLFQVQPKTNFLVQTV